MTGKDQLCIQSLRFINETLLNVFLGVFKNSVSICILLELVNNSKHEFNRLWDLIADACSAIRDRICVCDKSEGFSQVRAKPDTYILK